MQLENTAKWDGKHGGSTCDIKRENNGGEGGVWTWWKGNRGDWYGGIDRLYGYGVFFVYS